MDYGAEKMIVMLAPEIDRKCDEMKRVHREKVQSYFFVMLCIAMIVVPTVFVFFGMNLSSIVMPIIFIAIAFLMLSPILIHQQGGHIYE